MALVGASPEARARDGRSRSQPSGSSQNQRPPSKRASGSGRAHGSRGSGWPDRRPHHRRARDVRGGARGLLRGGGGWRRRRPAIQLRGLCGLPRAAGRRRNQPGGEPALPRGRGSGLLRERDPVVPEAERPGTRGPLPPRPGRQPRRWRPCPVRDPGAPRRRGLQHRAGGLREAGPQRQHRLPDPFAGLRCGADRGDPRYRDRRQPESQ